MENSNLTQLDLESSTKKVEPRFHISKKESHSGAYPIIEESSFCYQDMSSVAREIRLTEIFNKSMKSGCKYKELGKIMRENCVGIDEAIKIYQSKA